MLAKTLTMARQFEFILVPLLLILGFTAPIGGKHNAKASLASKATLKGVRTQSEIVQPAFPPLTFVPSGSFQESPQSSPYNNIPPPEDASTLPLTQIPSQIGSPRSPPRPPQSPH